MDEDELDKDISSYNENDGENSSEEDSEEESDDDDDAEKDEEGTDASSENEDGTDAVSEEEDEDGEAVSDDDDDNGGESASAAAAEETFDKGDLADLEDPDLSCPICLNELAGQDLGSPENCNHTFCYECILEWSKNINTCPIDRIEFHFIYVKQEINGDVIKKVKVKVKKEVEEYVEEVTLCEVCRLGDREDRLLLCDSCDSGYHCECLDPPLETIPIEEWFCPPCARVLNRKASPQASHSRLIARTSASEIVRSRIQHHRTAHSGDSSSETTQQPHRIRSPARVPRRRKTTKRKTKRKTTRKSSKSKAKTARTKATTAGKSKTKSSGKTPIKRKRKTKRRKSVKKKKKSKKSWLASMKLVAPSVKKRIADHLGLCKPPPGHSMPYVKKSGGQHSTFIEQLPSLNVFGCRDQLFDFNESYTDDDLDNPKPSTSKQSQAVASSVSRSPIAVASTSGINLLDNILEKQNNLLQNSKNITIGKDGSLNVNEKNSYVKIKCEIKSFKNESKNDASASEQSKAVLSSSMYVKKEKDILETDSPSADTNNKIISEDTSSSISALKCSVKKENRRLLPRVRFSDTETVFRIENNNVFEQVGTPMEGEYNLPCTSLSIQGKKDIPLEKVPVSVKKEKDNDLHSNSLMDTKSMNTELQTMVKACDVNRDRLNKEHRMNGKENHQFHKDSLAISSSVLNSTCKSDFCSEIGISGTSTNILNSPCSTDNCKSIKDISSSDNTNILHVTMVEASSSLFDKAENDRKRHLPFLSSSFLRPFKIPKLSKSKDTSLVSEMKSPPSSESISSKVLIRSENVCGNLKSKGKSLVSEKKLPSSESISNKVLTKSESVCGNFVPEEPTSINRTSSCDSKLKTGYKKHIDVSEAMDVDAHADQNNTSGAAANLLLQTPKEEKVSELCKGHKKFDLNYKSSLSVLPKLSHPKDGPSSSKRHNSEGTGNSLQKVHHTSRNGVTSDFMKFDRKMQGCSTSSSLKEVKSKECKHVLNVSVCVMQNSKPAEKSPPVDNAEAKASGKITDTVPSKHKLKEDIVAEIKKHLKDFYVTDLITKEEYKEIMRRSVPKVFQNCGNSIDSAKIRKLVVSYVNIIGNTKADGS